MPSKLLLKLIDEALLPAILVLLVKVGAAAFFVFFGQIDLSLSWQGFFPIFGFASSTDLLRVHVFSDLVLVSFLGLILFFLLLRIHFFHHQHISPSLTIKILNFNLGVLITNSFQGFTRAFVWISFLWLATFLVLLNVWVGVESLGALFFSLVISLTLTFLFFLDAEREWL